jgi:hypothetical protein
LPVSKSEFAPLTIDRYLSISNDAINFPAIFPISTSIPASELIFILWPPFQNDSLGRKISMFPPRYHGTVFNVQYSTEPTQKSPIRAHLVTSRDCFELIGLDWRTLLLTVPASELSSVESKKKYALLTFRPTSKFTSLYLNTRPEPLDSLVSALTQIVALPHTETRYLTHRVVVPSFKLTEKSQTNALQRGVMAQTCQFLQAFCSSAGSIAVNPAFVDVFTCVFRLRYRTDSTPLAVEACVRAVGLDVRRHFVRTWCAGIENCLRPAESSSAKIFYAQLAVHAAASIAKAANPLGISCDDLVLAAEQGARDQVESAARRIAKEAKEGMESELARVPPFDADNLDLLLDITVTLLAGIAAGMYAADVDNLAAKVVEFTQALLERGKVDENRRELVTTQTVFLKDMACLLEGQRYDEPFQFVFCTWPLIEKH